MSEEDKNAEIAKQEADGNSSEGEEDAPQVPEVAFEPQLSSNLAETSKQPDEQFRSKHPLFDAPELIDDKDDLNSPEKLSDDSGEDSEGEDEKKPAQLYEGEPSALMQGGGGPDSPISSLVPGDGDGAAAAEEQVPEWKKFTLPPTPLPDDTAIDAEIRERFDIAKLLQLIRRQE